MFEPPNDNRDLNHMLREGLIGEEEYVELTEVLLIVHAQETEGLATDGTSKLTTRRRSDV
jgi:hypothetical protein